ncbi:hypothetical protein, partial [Paraglaciecola sp.]|uniref:hypothetical protein n=1 Tax=Paraglaciecola sp. TaxID=1920173 RepID=UPI00329A1332
MKRTLFSHTNNNFHFSVDSLKLIPIIALHLLTSGQQVTGSNQYKHIRTLSSVGRASPLQGEGHWFK